MTVKDALGELHSFPSTLEPRVLATGVLEIRDGHDELAAIFAAGGWVVVRDEDER